MNITLAEYAELTDKSFDDVNILSFGGGMRPESVVEVTDFLFPDGEWGFNLAVVSI